MTLLAAVGLIREARLVEGPGVRALIGAGRSALLAARLGAALTQGAPRGVISIGIGGALDPALTVGDVVIGRAVLSADGTYPTDPAWTARLASALPQARIGAVFGADAMVLGVRDKARLRASSGAGVVDMESHVAAELAHAYGVPFSVLRVISDTADTSLPPAVLAGVSEDGAMNLAGVLAALARDPQQLPALIRVGRDSERAFKVLSRICAVLGSGMAR